MDVLLTGARGQVGTALRRLAPAEARLLCLARDWPEEGAGNPAHHAAAIDLGDLDAVERLLEKQRFDLIINAAAWTAVDAAVQQPAGAHLINAELPARLAGYAGRHGVPLVHFSTDYVFDGRSPEPYTEDATPAPLSVYGSSKLAGEQALIASGCEYLLLRTSWVYGGPGRNFLHTIAGKLLAGATLKVVDDQRGCPTRAREIARCIWQALEVLRQRPAFGQSLYHMAGAEVMSWYDFADCIRLALADAGALPPGAAVYRCASSDYPQQAARPANSSLDSGRFARDFGCRPAGREAIWQATLDYCRDRHANGNDTYDG